MSSQEGQGLRELMGLCFRELEIDMGLQLIQVPIPLVQILAITIDGKALKNDEMIIAFEVTAEGKKVTLGFVQTDAENAIVSMAATR